MKYLRYLAKCWNDPYNEKGQYYQTECQTADKQLAVNLADKYERVMVIDLLDNHKVVFWKGY